MKDETLKLSCGFCGKGRREVDKLIVANDVAICNECVDLCSNIIVKERVNKSAGSNKKFLNPLDVKEYLDKFIVGQTQAKIFLSVAIVNHFKRITYSSDNWIEKSNILIFGPSGSGKTLLAKTVAEYINVPFVIADATTLTEAGYVGDDVTSVIMRLYLNSGMDKEKTERGIIFLDEIDKISRKGENPAASRDVSGEGVQQSLLKLIEGTKCNLNVSKNETVEIDTSKILFIAAGAFVGLDKIVKERTGNNSIGFMAGTGTITEVNLEDAIPDDFTRYGMIPEFTGRFPVTVSTTELSVDHLISVLRETENNILKQMKFYFSVDEIELEFADEAIIEIAKSAHGLNIGARGLRSIVERILMPYFFTVKSLCDDNVVKITITKEVITANEPAILTHG